jgi:hypothetical protein
MVFIHRQYFTLVKKKLGLTYRLGYQGTIAGHTPFYFQPYMLSSFSYVTKTDGLGGAKNLRGVLRNRVVGDGVVWGNAEIRWRIVDFIVAKQNFYLGMNAFYDVGMVVQKYDLGEFNPASQPDYFDPDYDYDEPTRVWAPGSGWDGMRTSSWHSIMASRSKGRMAAGDFTSPSGTFGD